MTSRCARCISSDAAASGVACPSCNWRSARQGLSALNEAASDATAWAAFYVRVQGPDDSLRRIALFAMLVGEDGSVSRERARAALASGDPALYNAELLRLTDKLLDRIDEI